MSTARQLQLNWAQEFTKSFPLTNRSCYFTDDEFKKWHFAIGQRILCDPIWKHRTHVADRSGEEVKYLNQALGFINRAFASPLFPSGETKCMIIKAPYVPKLAAFHIDLALALLAIRADTLAQSRGLTAQKAVLRIESIINGSVQTRKLLETYHTTTIESRKAQAAAFDLI